MDLADLNGHVFVNNVSLGLYAADRALARVPRRQGRHDPGDPAAGARAGHRAVRPPLHRARRRRAPRRPRDPDLQQPLRHDGRRRSSRPRLDTHQLGVIALVLGQGRRRRGRSSPPSPPAIPERFAGFTSWATPTFEVTSDGPIDIGLDGETMVHGPAAALLDPPDARCGCGCRSTPSATHRRPGRSAGGPALRELWQVVLGRPTRFDA